MKRTRPSIAGVVSDRSDAFGLQRALDHGLDSRCLREPSAIWSWLLELDVDLVVLAGYLRLLPIVPEFAGRVLNIHPSLLPDFPGLGAAARQWRAGVRVAGATVHYVSPGLDDGPIIAQAAVPVMSADTEESLAARVLAAEHRLYPLALALVARGEAPVENGIVRTPGIASGVLYSPPAPEI